MRLVSQIVNNIAIIALICGMSPEVTALQPEDVLGEYWNDPLFGEAAAQQSLRLELLHRKLFPETVFAERGRTLQLVVDNRTAEAHMLVITDDPQALQNDAKFRRFRDDTLLHEQKTAAMTHHHHEHAEANAEAAQAMVKTLKQRPSVFVRAGERKEILLRFDEINALRVMCVLPGHEELGHHSLLQIVDSIAP